MGTLRGRVFFAKGRPAAYTNVILINTRRGAQTDEAGCFVVSKVPVGPRTLRIVYPGLRPSLNCALEVRSGENHLKDIIIEDRPSEIVPRPAPPPVAIGARAASRPEELEARIRPLQRRFRLGDSPAFEVRIRNRGSVPITLVRGVDGSESWANPRVRIEIDGPAGGYLAPDLAICGAGEGVPPGAFTRIRPGKDFDPYGGGWTDPRVYRGSFAKPGRYTATFRYATTETDTRGWMGCMCAAPELPDTLRKLLEQVPAVDLTATTTFEVEF